MPTKNEILAVRGLRNRKSRSEERKFTAEGRKLVEEAFASGWRIVDLYSTSHVETPDAWNAQRVSSKEMERMSNFRTPPGLLAVMEMPDQEASVLEEIPNVDDGGFTLALDGLSDPGNMGTVIRTADWFGVRGILATQDSVDIFNPKVVQATMGAIFRVPVQVVDLPQALSRLAESGARIQGLDLQGRSLWDTPSTVPSHQVAVCGSESHGISEETRAACTEFVHIPGGGQTESLNASMAAGIVMAAWHARRLS
ncbi:MAG: RNA methyltransferase [Flavobacteriales bacterium]|nr:RNA methyltransferase [Flavobacteriales bacterium]